MYQNGFTLMELMIVVAVVGILASIGLPAYQDYLIRARVTEGLLMVSAAKLAVTESVVSDHALPENQEATGYVTPSPTNNVQSITIADDGSAEITIDYRPVAGGGTLVFSPILSQEGELHWNCFGGSLIGKYRPAVCRA